RHTSSLRDWSSDVCSSDLDLSLVLPAGVTAAAVADVLRREGGSLLERLEMLDEYRGPGLPAATRGVTWRCTFRAPDRTLTEQERSEERRVGKECSCRCAWT